MTDSPNILKRTIEHQQEHIEILQRHNEFLRKELEKRKPTLLASKFETGKESLSHGKLGISSFSKEDWFYILHGLMTGTFVYLYLSNYEIIRAFYL